MATLSFNLGPSGFQKLLEQLNCDVGLLVQQSATKATLEKLRKAERSASETVQTRRKRRKLNLVDKNEKAVNKEGKTYGAGDFND